MISYVVGFLFDNPEDYRVTLIRKNRPAWQVGKLNGIGGKIQDRESPLQAMVREFREETGVITHPDEWREFCLIKGGQWEVYFFEISIYKGKRYPITIEDEDVNWYYVDCILCKWLECCPQIYHLIPLALDKNAKYTYISYRYDWETDETCINCLKPQIKCKCQKVI